MSDLDTRLDQALKAGAPAPRDPMFRIAVMARRERADMRRRLGMAMAAAAGVAILAALALGLGGDLLRPGPEQPAMLAVFAVVIMGALAAASAVITGGFRAALTALRARTGAALRLRLWS